MPSPRLIAVITALTCLSGASGAYAAYTLDQLREIERFIVTKDCGGLRALLDRDPSLMAGTDPLAAELRNFATGVDNGFVQCLSARSEPVTRADPLAAVLSRQY